MSFKRGQDPKKALRIGRTVLDDLKDHSICKPMNDPWKDADPHKDPDFQVRINPHNQFCFNSMWCSEKDLEDWMEGRGKMVKGTTKAEKKKYWDYAVFEGGDHDRWLIKYTWKWFDRMVTDFNPWVRDMYGLNMFMKTPIKIKRKTKEELQNQKNAENVIVAMFAPFVDEIKAELEYRDFSSIRNEYDKYFLGIKRALFCMGVGFIGACNLPEEIENLSWVTDVVYAKALYLHLKEKGEVELPDFEWLCNRNYYND